MYLLDEKGNVLQGAGVIRRGRLGPISENTMEFNIPAGREPAKFIYAATKSVAVDVPFTLKDIPLR